MASVRELKRRITSVNKTQQITKAMKMVSAARLRRAQENIVKARPYAYKLKEVLCNVAPRVDRSMHPLLDIREPNKVAYIVVTSDKGLCGGFNSNIIRKAKQVIEEDNYPDPTLICVGRKGYEHFKNRDYKILDKYINFFNNLDYSHAQVIADKIIELYLGKELDKIVLIYNEFKSAIRQDVIVEELLPVDTEETEKKVSEIDYIYEPSPIGILDTILPLQVAIQTWRVLLESTASEHGARMTAMESATDNASEMIKNLTLSMNRQRQAIITTEIAEIVGGAEALK